MKKVKQASNSKVPLEEDVNHVIETFTNPDYHDWEYEEIIPLSREKVLVVFETGE